MQKRDVDSARKRLHPAKTVRFQTKTPRFGVIARPQRGRGNLKAEGMASRGEAREHEARGKPYHKKWICRVVPLSLSFFQGSVSFRATIVRSGMANRSVKDCRVGRTRRPPRNDKSCGFCGKSEQFPERNDWKRNDFRNETFEKRCGAIPRKNCARRGNDKKPAGFCEKPTGFLIGMF